MKQNMGPTPQYVGIARSRRSGCASTILAYVFAALAFFSAFGSTRSAHAQDDAAADAVANDAPSDDAAAVSDAAQPPRAPAQGQVGQAVVRAEQTTGVTAGGRCAPGEPDCLEVTEETEHREYRYACRQDTSDCVDDTTCGGDRQQILYERGRAQVRRFRREVRRELAEIHRQLNEIRAINGVQDERISALESYDQQFFGWSADTSPRERMRIARETGRYLHDTVPALIMEEEIDRMEVDGELRGAIDAAERARRDFESRANDKFTEIERSLAATNRRIDDAQRYQLTATLFGGLFHRGGSPSATEGVVGFTLGSRPWDVPITVVGRFYAGLGQTHGDNDRGTYSLAGDVLAGYEWSGGRVLVGGTGMMLSSTKWRETSLFAGGGPMARIEIDPHRSVTIGAGLAGLFGNAVNPVTGVSFDSSGWSVTVDVGLRLGRWGH